MTIFQLFVYSCLTLNYFDGALLSKTCRWQSWGDPFVDSAKCERAGKDQLGHPIFSDVAEDRHIQKARCEPMAVTQ